MYAQVMLRSKRGHNNGAFRVEVSNAACKVLQKYTSISVLCQGNGEVGEGIIYLCAFNVMKKDARLSSQAASWLAGTTLANEYDWIAQQLPM